jgi:hypothetical protein
MALLGEIFRRYQIDRSANVLFAPGCANDCQFVEDHQTRFSGRGRCLLSMAGAEAKAQAECGKAVSDQEQRTLLFENDFQFSCHN